MFCGKEGVCSLVIIDVLDAPFKIPLAISKLFNVFISAIVAIMLDQVNAFNVFDATVLLGKTNS